MHWDAASYFNNRNPVDYSDIACNYSNPGLYACSLWFMGRFYGYYYGEVASNALAYRRLHEFQYFGGDDAYNEMIALLDDTING